MIDISQIRPVWAEVDLDALAHNLGEVRRLCGSGVLVTAVIKANGYGHGAGQVARVMLESGADRLAVATLDEALELRRAGISARILVLGYTEPQHALSVVTNQLDVCVYQRALAGALSDAAAQTGRQALVHIKVDTGMGRIGLRPEAAVAAAAEMVSLPGISFEGAFTHFAVADQTDKHYTEQQLTRFRRILADLADLGHRPKLRHCANSAAIIDLPQAHLDMVRPGIMLYGILPSAEVRADLVDLWPAMRFKARISHVKTIEVGDSVSYGRKFIAERPTVVASLPLGYADGYHRSLTNRGEVLVKGRRAPIIGTVCMDQCMIDVTDIAGVGAGDEVTLYGDAELLRCEQVAEWAGTIGYELVTSVARRVPRVYFRAGQPVDVVNYLQ